MRVTYFGQACTLIEVAGKKILTDPWLTEGAYFGTWFHTHLIADAGVTPETFPKDVDYLFLSHEHQDHVDPATLRHFSPQIPVLICKFATAKFRRYVEGLGFHNIWELPSGERVGLDDEVTVTIFGSAEYTNDAALLVEGDGCALLNETDCKLSYPDLERLGQRRIDIGFYMFSGANWYPMMYDYPDEVQRALVCRRRRALLRSLVQRVKVTKPRVVVPAAGPCTVLDPDLLWLNSAERGIFIDPEEAVAALKAAQLPTEPLYMAATDAWDSRSGFERRAPVAFRMPRQEYIRAASERMAAQIRRRRAAEPPAGSDLPQRLMAYFNTLVAAQTPLVRRCINAKLALVVTGRHGGAWTVDFTSSGPEYTYEGLASDWTYKIEVEDKLLYPFLTGQMPFFEDLLLSLRVRLARRPDVYNEALYHFFYEPDPERLHTWYATHCA
jgi:UDP-MurNAc hydroxylase